MSTDRLAELKANLNSAREEYRAALKFQYEADQLLRDLLGTSDGTHALSKANRTSAQAVKKYMKALREFTDYVLDETQQDASGSEE